METPSPAAPNLVRTHQWVALDLLVLIHPSIAAGEHPTAGIGSVTTRHHWSRPELLLPVDPSPPDHLRSSRAPERVPLGPLKVHNPSMLAQPRRTAAPRRHRRRQAPALAAGPPPATLASTETTRR